MGRNNFDFFDSFEPLYHGSKVRLEPGDIVKPSRHPVRDAETDKSYAHATTDHEFAKSYAWQSESNPGWIHVVEPLEDDDTLEDDGQHHVVSQKGFRVLSVTRGTQY